MSDELVFHEEGAPDRRSRQSWTVLIVDDEREVHAVTELALGDFSFGGRELEFLHAYSGAEARQLFAEHDDIALVLLDVVMETDDAGLRVVEYVRNTLKNPFVRIVLRTGQPGQAPELGVITRYDINDYKYKTELTRERLYTTVYTGLSVYRDLRALDANRRGLEKVLEASARIFELRSMDRFAQGVLEQLSALLFLDREALIVHASGVAAQDGQAPLQIIAGTGTYAGLIGRPAAEVLPPEVMSRLDQARQQRQPIYGEEEFVGYDDAAGEMLFYLRADQPISVADRHLIELFYRNVAIARVNLELLSTSKLR